MLGYRRQPRVANVDWGNRLTRHLAFAFTPTNTNEIVSGAKGGFYGTASFKDGIHGIGINCTAGGFTASGYSFATSRLITLNGNFGDVGWTGLALFSSFTVAQGSNQANVVGPSATGANGLGVTTSNKFALYRNAVAFQSSTSVPSGRSVWAATGVYNAAQRIFFNGEFDATSNDNLGFNATFVPDCVGGAPGQGSIEDNIALVLLWNRILSDDEIKNISDNPWQVFRRPRGWWQGTAIATGPSITYDYAYPESDITTDSWLNETAGLPLYPSLADSSTGTPNDATYIYSPDNPTTQEFEVKFGALYPPTGGVTTNHYLKYRLRALGMTTSFRMTLMCGATQIAQWTESVTVASGIVAFTKTLSGAEAASITDYANLRLRGRASAAVFDSFNRANASPAGGNWITHPDFAPVAIAGNQLQAAAAVGEAVAYYNTSLPADQYCQLRIVTNNPNALGVMCRINPATGDGYLLAIISSALQWYKRVGHSWINITTNITRTNSVGDVVRLEVVGSTLTARVNGTIVGTCTDGAITAAGYAGVYDDWQTVNGVLDDFEAGAI